MVMTRHTPPLLRRRLNQNQGAYVLLITPPSIFMTLATRLEDLENVDMSGVDVCVGGVQVRKSYDR